MIKKKWYPTIIKGKKLQKFANYINEGANKNNNVLCNDEFNKRKVSSYGMGYNQAVLDIFKRLELDFK